MSNKYQDKGLLFIVSAPSGAGKTSLIRELIKANQEVVLSISHTTRKSRKKERNGIDYYFVSEEQFRQMEINKEFLETANVFGKKYGTTKQTIEQTINMGKSVILDIDWQGARELKKSHFQSVSIFILPPTLQALNGRLLDRGDDPIEIQARMNKAIKEISHYREYDYVITNEIFETSLQAIESIITGSFYCFNLRKKQFDHLVQEIIENQ